MSSSVSYSAPGVQFLAERKGVPPRHQALLPQHQVPAGHRQRRRTSPCREALLSHLHEVTASGFSPHQALLQLIGEVPISKKLLHNLSFLCEEADAPHLSSLFSIFLSEKWMCLCSAPGDLMNLNESQLGGFLVFCQYLKCKAWFIFRVARLFSPC